MSIIRTEDGGEARKSAPSANHDHDALVRLWLGAVVLLVFAMIVVGGATRLTDSGLSITEWRPILGALPPLSDADWQTAFAKYKEIPEYRLVNSGMSLDAFKVIYWWEWSHRFLGRFIGLAFAAPLAFFWAMGHVRGPLAWKLLGILALGGLQGAIGWYMVQSGLADRVDVSQYRLALHLGVAFVILGALVWVALSLEKTVVGNPPLPNPPPQGGREWRPHFAAILLGLVFVQVILGAFVAGLRAGLVHNTWPLMEGRLIPKGLLTLDPWYLNLTENVTAAQFNHRVLAYAIVLLTAAHVWRLRRDGALDASGAALLAAVFAQAGLGVWTLLANVPIGLGLLHQAGAAILFVVSVWHLRRTTRG